MHRGADHLLVVVLGSTGGDGRYDEARKLLRWSWERRGNKRETGGPAGFDELDRRVEEEIERVQFGLMPEFIGFVLLLSLLY